MVDLPFIAEEKHKLLFAKVKLSFFSLSFHSIRAVMSVSPP